LIDELPADEVVLYVDEVDIHLNPKIGADWMLPGQQKTAPTPRKNEKRYLGGALSGQAGRIDWVEATCQTSDLFLALVQTLATTYTRARRIHVVLDAFTIHGSQRVKAALAAWVAKAELHFLPPYSPNNPIERLGTDLHDNVTRNRGCPRMDSLMQEVYLYLEERRKNSGHCYLQAV
jgi:transposase